MADETTGPRVLIKSWRNGRGGKWTIRIRYYEGISLDNVRLSLEDSEMKCNIYPNDRAHAELLYQRFKTEAPKAENDEPFVAQFIKSIERDKT